MAGSLLQAGQAEITLIGARKVPLPQSRLWLAYRLTSTDMPISCANDAAKFMGLLTEYLGRQMQTLRRRFARAAKAPPKWQVVEATSPKA